MSEPLTCIAIDIDDVVANSIARVREWANEKTGRVIEPHHYHTDDEYWNYYNSIWLRHGVADQLVFEDYMTELDVDQSKIKTHVNAKEAILKLRENYELVFITSRPPSMKDSTRRWLDENIDTSIPLYLAVNPLSNQTAKSKGELCIELGAGLLIDDNVDNCNSALDAGVGAILFGDYGWNKNAPETMQRGADWNEVLELLDGR